MNKPRLFLFVPLLAVFVAAFFYRDALFETLAPQFANFENKVLDIAILEIKKEISTPEPLRIFEKPSREGVLTVAGVVQWTNVERAKFGLPPLRGDTELNAAAKIRLDDMFTHQYFAHESPSGKDAAYAVEVAEYAYISLGENLALGIFEGDHDIVAAWMNSPGHRANILKGDFEEIGVAVKKGAFEGEETWIAVQVFARPSSSCPEVPPELRDEIDAKQARLKELQEGLAALKEEMENMPRGKERNEKVENYNATVNRYNELLQAVKPLIAAYNEQANAYNACIGR